MAPAPLLPPPASRSKSPSWQRTHPELPRYVYRDPERHLALIGAWRRREHYPPRTRSWTGPPGPAADPDWEELKGKDSPRSPPVSGLQSPRPRWPISKSSTRVAGRSQTTTPPRRPEDPHRPRCEFLADRTERGDHRAAAHGPENSRRHPGATGPTPALEHGREDATKITAKVHEIFAEGPGGHVQAMPSADSPLRSVYSAGMRELVGRLDGSILVLTYQTGKLICLRTRAHGQHPLPQTRQAVWVAVHQGGSRSAAARGLGLPRRSRPRRRGRAAAPTDACTCPATGTSPAHRDPRDRFAHGELWLCAPPSRSRDAQREHSFVPRWKAGLHQRARPRRSLPPQRQCVVDDEVRYVTALGRTDKQVRLALRQGARRRHPRGPSSDVIVDGPLMPAFASWHTAGSVSSSQRGRALTSPTSTPRVDEPSPELPGFTRGSPSSTRSPSSASLRSARRRPSRAAADRAADQSERLSASGRHTTNGQTLGFLRFEELVQEVFDIAIRPKQFPRSPSRAAPQRARRSHYPSRCRRRATRFSTLGDDAAGRRPGPRMMGLKAPAKK